MEPEKESSWLRLLVTIAIDWRLVIAALAIGTRTAEALTR